MRKNISIYVEIDVFLFYLFSPPNLVVFAQHKIVRQGNLETIY